MWALVPVASLWPWPANFCRPRFTAAISPTKRWRWPASTPRVWRWVGKCCSGSPICSPCTEKKNSTSLFPIHRGFTGDTAGGGGEKTGDLAHHGGKLRLPQRAQRTQRKSADQGSAMLSTNLIPLNLFDSDHPILFSL